ncbi:TPR-like protein [Piedraia hortae CBS 480.64]|uniref:TPR-like protein n=1 Tax=Piedraia hortae CBS 480.64 TaxID=1314780 RepID=A0A6A7BW66_9PEZI|nr:TPR-like protein [Piedraia hortae CBS 480.64]
MTQSGRGYERQESELEGDEYSDPDFAESSSDSNNDQPRVIPTKRMMIDPALRGPDDEDTEYGPSEEEQESLSEPEFPGYRGSKNVQQVGGSVVRESAVDGPSIDRSLRRSNDFWNSRDSDDLGYGRPAKRPKTRSNTEPENLSRRTPSRRSRGYKWALKGTEHDPARIRAKERAEERRIMKEQGRYRRPRRRKEVDPGPVYTDHFKRACTAYMQKRNDDAMEQVLLAIETNPAIFDAHRLLSDIYLRQGDKKASLTALTASDKVRRDAETWIEIAERTLDIAGEDGDEQMLTQALSAYRSAVALSKQATTDEKKALNYQARVGKRDLQITLGKTSDARRTSKHMLYFNPGDMENVGYYAQLSAQSTNPQEIDSAIEAYEKAFEAHQGNEHFAEGPVQWTHINLYIELLEKKGPSHAQKALAILKCLARWTLGREEEAFWDKYEDNDCEFDIDNKRRHQVPEFEQGQASQDLNKYGKSLPLQIRAKLGLIRISMGEQHFNEGLYHLNHLLTSPESELDDEAYLLFLNVADRLKNSKLWNEALKFYTIVQELWEISDEMFLLNMGQCYAQVSCTKEAEETFDEVIRLAPGHIAARLELAKLYEGMGRVEEAIMLGMEVKHLAAINADQGNKSSGEANKLRKQRRPLRTGMSPSSVAGRRGYRGATLFNGERVETRLQRMELDQGMVRTHYKTVKELWPIIEEGDFEDANVDRWMAAAAAMATAFRNMDVFFPSAKRVRPFTGYQKRGRKKGPSEEVRTAVSMLSRLRAEDDEDEEAESETPSNIPDDFHSIQFPEWHHLFVDLALLYAKRADQSSCYDLLKNVMFTANVFYCKSELHSISLSAALCCAMMFNDSSFATDLGREFVKRGDYRAGEPYQLLAATNRLTYGPTWGGDGRLLKFMARMIKFMDYNLLPPDIRNQIDYQVQITALESRLVNLGEGNGELDAGILALYGHTIVICNNHPNAALPYYLRALALQPENASICLCIAVSHMANCMKRSTNNRHAGIVQGLAFLGQYYDLCTRSGNPCDVQEATYNVARAYHGLGLTHLALPRYKKVLKMDSVVRNARNGYQGFAREAALAMQQMALLAVNPERADAITSEMLVL